MSHFSSSWSLTLCQSVTHLGLCGLRRYIVDTSKLIEWTGNRKWWLKLSRNMRAKISFREGSNSRWIGKHLWVQQGKVGQLIRRLMQLLRQWLWIVGSNCEVSCEKRRGFNGEILLFTSGLNDMKDFHLLQKAICLTNEICQKEQTLITSLISLFMFPFFWLTSSRYLHSQEFSCFYTFLRWFVKWWKSPYINYVVFSGGWGQTFFYAVL